MQHSAKYCCSNIVFAHVGKYDEQHMITVTKRILQSEKSSQQQYITIIVVVLSNHTNILACCNTVYVKVGNTMYARWGMHCS
jgi:hypothetical protein